MPTWCFLLDPPLPGQANMDRDLELLHQVKAGYSTPVFRLYTWSPPAVSLGRHQAREEVVDERECRAMGVDVVRRPTGGRAVVHWDELTYSMVMPVSYPGLPRGWWIPIAG